MSVFSLATVLGVRRRQEDAARAEVGRAQVNATARERRAAALDARIDRLGFPDAATASAFVAAQAARRALASTAAAARVVAAEARGQVAESLEAWTDARRRVRLLEELEERHRTQERREAEHAEAAETDDRAATTWWRDRSDDGQTP